MIIHPPDRCGEWWSNRILMVPLPHSIYGRQLLWTFLQSACRLHVNSKPATSLGSGCLIKLHILERPFIVTSSSNTCALIMLCTHHHDEPHLSDGWIISATERRSLVQTSTALCLKNLREMSVLGVWMCLMFTPNCYFVSSLVKSKWSEVLL